MHCIRPESVRADAKGHCHLLTFLLPALSITLLVCGEQVRLNVQLFWIHILNRHLSKFKLQITLFLRLIYWSSLRVDVELRSDLTKYEVIAKGAYLGLRMCHSFMNTHLLIVKNLPLAWHLVGQRTSNSSSSLEK